MKKLFKYFSGYTKWAVLSPILVLIAVSMNVYIPRLTGQMIDQGILQSDLPTVVRIGAIMAGAALLAMIFGGLASYAAAIASQGFGANLRKTCYRQIQDFDFANLDSFSVPSLITRLTSDIDRMTMMAQLSLRMAVRAPIMFIAALVMAVQINTRLSLALILAIPTMTLVIIVIGRKAQHTFRRQQDQVDRLNASVRENLTAIRIVKSFVREDFEIEKFERENQGLRDISLTAMLQIIKIPTSMMIIVGLTIVAVLYYGSKGIIEGWLLPGDLFSFLMYLNMVLMSVGMLFSVLINYVRAKASADRIFEVLAAKPTIKESPNPITEMKDGSLELIDLSFRYPGSSVDNLSQINLKLESGEKLAIIGSTGSGKSSLVQLLARLYEASSGQIIIAGQPIEKYSLKTLRQGVAIVLQKNTLFRGSIRDNLLWGKPDASDQELWTALKIAQAEDLVKGREGGLDATVEQGGANFSGGQKQRLTIARSLLKQPKIIIFDDSSSALDLATSRQLEADLAKSLPGLTQIIIAQRISSVQNADRILVLDQGRISGIGKHADLYASNQVYREICESQAKGVEA